jgi:hypothetical protein
LLAALHTGVVSVHALALLGVHATHRPSSLHAGAPGSFARHSSSLVHGTHAMSEQIGFAGSAHSTESVHPVSVVLLDALSVSLPLFDIDPVPAVVGSPVGSVVGSVAPIVTDELDASATPSQSGSSTADLPSPHGE